MESQQLMELQLKKMDANQEKADVMLANLDANQEKVVADRKADKEEMEANIKAW
jgi:hypothetical protein